MIVDRRSGDEIIFICPASCRNKCKTSSPTQPPNVSSAAHSSIPSLEPRFSSSSVPRFTLDPSSAHTKTSKKRNNESSHEAKKSKKDR
jgi:hypothetical protein